MKSKAKKISTNTKKVRAVRSVYNELLVKKEHLFGELTEIEEAYNSLSSTAKTESEWMNGLPITSMADLVKFESSKLIGNLQALRERSKLKKSSVIKVKEIKDLELELKLAKIDVLIAKSNALMEKID